MDDKTTISSTTRGTSTPSEAGCMKFREVREVREVPGTGSSGDSISILVTGKGSGLTCGYFGQQECP